MVFSMRPTSSSWNRTAGCSSTALSSPESLANSSLPSRWLTPALKSVLRLTLRGWSLPRPESATPST